MFFVRCHNENQKSRRNPIVMLLLNLYILIIIITVQSKLCGPWHVYSSSVDNQHDASSKSPSSLLQNVPLNHVPHFREFGNGNKAVIRGGNHKRRLFKAFKSGLEKSTDTSFPDEVKQFDSIREFQPTTRLTTVSTTKLQTPNVNFGEIKKVLLKLIKEIDSITSDKKRQCDLFTTTTKDKIVDNKKPAVEVKEETQAEKAVQPESKESHSILDVFKGKNKGGKKAKWTEWTDWSACSVSCGKGREIRWRHCKEDCNDIETEMEEKTCQLPACGPGKLFGVINL